MARLWYAYGIVAAQTAVADAPAGLDGAKVVMRRAGDVAALVSELDGDEYDPAAIEARSGDVDWVAERAVAHDRVLTWASDRGAVIPLPMFTSMFGSAERVDEMLRTRGSTLQSVLERVGRGREYALRVYRVDAELKAALPMIDPEIASLAAAAKAASPGQRYLLERKLDERVKEELRATSQRIAAGIRDDLSRLALDSVLSPIPRVTAEAPGTMVLNAAFLVAPDGLRGFQERLTEIVAERQPSGFRFDFTGPWPPYHFAPSDADE
jgi:hypothetical protein